MPSSSRNVWLLAVGLLPALVTLFAGMASPRPAPIAARAPNPPLAFTQYGVSYPEVRPFPQIEAYFTFENRGDQTVTIDKIEPSCGCVRWELAGEKQVFQPGERGRITLMLHTANEQAGEHDYSIAVTSHDSQPHREELTFRLTLPERKVTVEPREVYFYQLHGQPDERFVYIIDYRDDPVTPLEVTSVHSRSSQVAAEVMEAERDEVGHRRVPIRVSVPAEVKPGREITHVTVTTNDPLFPRISLPVLVQGRSASRVGEIAEGAAGVAR
ncbi:MAG: DUF1573 domain-containing protein [Planctomycetaceae bacterium]